MPLREQRTIVSSMTLRWSDIADATMAVLMIIPVDKEACPLPRGTEITESSGRERRLILRGAEQRLDKGIVVAHPWT